MVNLVEKLLQLAAQRGFTQRHLASAAGVKEESISRAKARGSAQLRLVQSLAEAAQIEVALVPRSMGPSPALTTNPAEFRAKHRALVWSNTTASDDILIRRTLVRPEFDRMVDAVAAFGLEKIELEWQILLDDNDPDARRARSITERLLRNARAGFEIASA